MDKADHTGSIYIFIYEKSVTCLMCWSLEYGGCEPTTARLSLPGSGSVSSSSPSGLPFLSLGSTRRFIRSLQEAHLQSFHELQRKIRTLF